MPRQVEEPQASAELQEFDVAVGDEAEAGVALVLALQGKSLGDVHAWRPAGDRPLASTINQLTTATGSAR